MEKGEAAERLRMLADYFEYWTTWNKKQRDQEGIETTADTHIYVVPPHWPSHGTVAHWCETLRSAAEIVQGG